MSEPMTAEERDHARRTAEALASLEAKWDAVVVAAVRHGWEEGETLPEFIDWLAARWHREAAEVSRLAAERERDAAAAHEVIQAMQKANDEALAALAAENERLRVENAAWVENFRIDNERDMQGTRHISICSSYGPVGEPGCVCPVGRRIREKDKQLASAAATIERLRAAIDTLAGHDGTRWRARNPENGNLMEFTLRPEAVAALAVARELEGQSDG